MTRLPILRIALALLCGGASIAPGDGPATAAPRPVSRPTSFLGSKAGDEREIGGVKLCWCELLGRNWIGIELDASAIVERFENIDADANYLARLSAGKNLLFTPESLKLRKQFGHDTSKYRLNSFHQAQPHTTLQPTLL